VVKYNAIGVCCVHWDRFVALKSDLKEQCSKKESGKVSDSKRGIEMHITPYFHLLMILWPGDWKKQLSNLKNQISNLPEKRESNKQKTGQ
jgi:hypothetical protein